MYREKWFLIQFDSIELPSIQSIQVFFKPIQNDQDLSRQNAKLPVALWWSAKEHLGWCPVVSGPRLHWIVACWVPPMSPCDFREYLQGKDQRGLHTFTIYLGIFRWSDGSLRAWYPETLAIMEQGEEM